METGRRYYFTWKRNDGDGDDAIQCEITGSELPSIPEVDCEAVAELSSGEVFNLTKESLIRFKQDLRRWYQGHAARLYDEFISHLEWQLQVQPPRKRKVIERVLSPTL